MTPLFGAAGGELGLLKQIERRGELVRLELIQLRDHDHLRDLGQGGGAEDLCQIDCHFQAALHMADHRDGEERIAAEVEEVVVSADALETEELLPDGGDGQLGVALRRFELLGGEGRVIARLRVSGLSCDVRTLFSAAVLAQLALALTETELRL